MNGSITAVVGSGMTSMSDALIGCQPRIDEPSKPLPSSKSSSFELAHRNREVLPGPEEVEELQVDRLTPSSLSRT